jgi:hypothetical protein
LKWVSNFKDERQSKGQITAPTLAEFSEAAEEAVEDYRSQLLKLIMKLPASGF